MLAIVAKVLNHNYGPANTKNVCVWLGKPQINYIFSGVATKGYSLVTMPLKKNFFAASLSFILFDKNIVVKRNSGDSKSYL